MLVVANCLDTLTCASLPNLHCALNFLTQIYLYVSSVSLHDPMTELGKTFFHHYVIFILCPTSFAKNYICLFSFLHIIIHCFGEIIFVRPVLLILLVYHNFFGQHHIFSFVILEWYNFFGQNRIYLNVIPAWSHSINHRVTHISGTPLLAATSVTFFK